MLIIGKRSESQIIKCICFISGTLHSGCPLYIIYLDCKGTMADDTIEQIRVYIQEILHLALNVKGRMLRRLNELVGQTSKFELQSITNMHAKVIIVENYHVESGQKEKEFLLFISIELKELTASDDQKCG